MNHDSRFGLGDQDTRIRDQRKPACIDAKRVLIAVGLPSDFVAFLLVFEREAVEAFAGLKRHGDLD